LPLPPTTPFQRAPSPPGLQLRSSP
jgi:hypothetical protein